MKYVKIKTAKEPMVIVLYDKKTKKKQGTMGIDKFRKFMENGYAPKKLFIQDLVKRFNKEPEANYASLELNK